MSSSLNMMDDDGEDSPATDEEVVQKMKSSKAIKSPSTSEASGSSSGDSSGSDSDSGTSSGDESPAIDNSPTPAVSNKRKSERPTSESDADTPPPKSESKEPPKKKAKVTPAVKKPVAKMVPPPSRPVQPKFVAKAPVAKMVSQPKSVEKAPVAKMVPQPKSISKARVKKAKKPRARARTAHDRIVHPNGSPMSNNLPYPVNSVTTQEKILAANPRLSSTLSMFQEYRKANVVWCVLFGTLDGARIALDSMPETDDLIVLEPRTSMVSGFGHDLHNPIYSVPSVISPGKGSQLLIWDFTNLESTCVSIRTEHTFIADTFVDPKDVRVAVSRSLLIAQMNRLKPHQSLFVIRRAHSDVLEFQAVDSHGDGYDFSTPSIPLLTMPHHVDMDNWTDPLFNMSSKQKKDAYALIRLERSTLRDLVASDVARDRNKQRKSGGVTKKRSKKSPDEKDDNNEVGEDVKESLIMLQLVETGPEGNKESFLTISIGAEEASVSGNSVTCRKLFPWHGQITNEQYFSGEGDGDGFISLTEDITELEAKSEEYGRQSAAPAGPPGLDALMSLNDSEFTFTKSAKTQENQSHEGASPFDKTLTSTIACCIFSVKDAARALTSTRNRLPLPPIVLLFPLDMRKNIEVEAQAQEEEDSKDCIRFQFGFLQHSTSNPETCAFTIFTTIPQRNATDDLIDCMPKPEDLKLMWTPGDARSLRELKCDLKEGL